MIPEPEWFEPRLGPSPAAPRVPKRRTSISRNPTISGPHSDPSGWSLTLILFTISVLLEGLEPLRQVPCYTPEAPYPASPGQGPSAVTSLDYRPSCGPAPDSLARTPSSLSLG